MSTPFMHLAPPPLPAGWTEHTSPAGQPYYYNAATKESTYVRPLPSFNAMPPPPTSKPKKEKPRLKTPVPGTDWLRVVTTRGNIFYTHRVQKKSVWAIPDEIKDAVALLDQEQEEEKKEAENTLLKAEEERLRGLERTKAEAQDAVGKRKAEEPVPVDEMIISKKARVDVEEEADEDEDESESDMEDWQREAAEQLAKETEEEKEQLEAEKKQAEEEKARELKEAELQKSRPLNMPARVDLSLDEAKALFKTLLREKDINPLHPWDTSLPLFVSDPRYVLLPSVSARREAFDEYCRDRARELRQSQVKKEKQTLTSKDEFERLLSEEIKSTRTTWTEWRRQWRKDRRFYGWGRDDRERERRFREYLRELGEKKRATAQKAETDFFALLKESGETKAGVLWKDVKKNIMEDPRYDAVGSSSLREELFDAFLKAQATSKLQASEPDLGKLKSELHQDSRSTGALDANRERLRRERKERAVKEREEKIRAKRSKVEADIDKSRQDLSKGEDELEYRTMLVDAIRDPFVSWDIVLPQLKTDPRFTNSRLPWNQQLHLFHAHIDQLKSKHLAGLHTLFLSHAPSLATPFTSLPVSSIVSSLPATKLGYDIQELENVYSRWQRERSEDARRAFDEMLNDNAFVEFWGRLGKIGGKGVDEGIKADDIGEDAEEIVDMKVLAKTVDLKEMVKVLRGDKRYLMFDHMPEQRERWLRDHLAQLSAPKLSVHVPETA